MYEHTVLAQSDRSSLITGILSGEWRPENVASALVSVPKTYVFMQWCTYLLTYLLNYLVTQLARGVYKKLSYCWETVRRESIPRIAEMDVEMTTWAEMTFKWTSRSSKVAPIES